MVFECLDCFFGVRKSLTTQFLLDGREQEEEVIGCQIRTVGRMTHQFDVLSAQKCICLTKHVIENDSSSAVGFANFSEDFRQTNSRLPLRIDRPTLLKWNSGHMTHSAEETGDHLLRSASCANNFCWIWLVLEHPHGRLLLCSG